MLRVVSFPNPSQGEHAIAIAFQVVSSPLACVFVTAGGWKVQLTLLPLGKTLAMFFQTREKDQYCFSDKLLFFLCSVMLTLLFCKMFILSASLDSDCSAGREVLNLV